MASQKKVITPKKKQKPVQLIKRSDLVADTLPVASPGVGKALAYAVPKESEKHSQGQNCQIKPESEALKTKGLSNTAKNAEKLEIKGQNMCEGDTLTFQRKSIPSQQNHKIAEHKRAKVEESTKQDSKNCTFEFKAGNSAKTAGNVQSMEQGNVLTNSAKNNAKGPSAKFSTDPETGCSNMVMKKTLKNSRKHSETNHENPKATETAKKKHYVSKAIKDFFVPTSKVKDVSSNKKNVGSTSMALDSTALDSQAEITDYPKKTKVELESPQPHDKIADVDSASTRNEIQSDAKDFSHSALQGETDFGVRSDCVPGPSDGGLMEVKTQKRQFSRLQDSIMKLISKCNVDLEHLDDKIKLLESQYFKQPPDTTGLIKGWEVSSYMNNGYSYITQSQKSRKGPQQRFKSIITQSQILITEHIFSLTSSTCPISKALINNSKTK